MTWDGGRIKASERQAAARGLRKAAEHILQVSRSQVPHEEGTLENSGTASVDSNALRGAVSYDTPYAVRQHEELDWRHDNGRKAKYLEDPMRDERGVVGDLIATELRRELK